MAWISARTLIVFRSSFLWSLAYILVSNPTSFTEHPTVLLLSRSMDMDLLAVKDERLLGFCAMLMTVMALSDLPALTVNNYTEYFGVSVPLRLAFYFIILGYSFIFHNRSFSNSVVFTVGFIEITLNFWIFTVLREERNELRKAAIHRHHEVGDNVME